MGGEGLGAQLPGSMGIPKSRVMGSADVDTVEVMGTKGCVALGALPLAGLIAAPHALKAENVEALGKNCILLAGVTAGAGQPRLGQAKVSAWEQSLQCPDPKLTAGGSGYALLQPTASNSDNPGRWDAHCPHQETDSEAGLKVTKQQSGF